jgi:hypothetical protein
MYSTFLLRTGFFLQSWDIDLKTFGMEVVLDQKLAMGSLKRFKFVEREPQCPIAIEPGSGEFLRTRR